MYTNAECARLDAERFKEEEEDNRIRDENMLMEKEYERQRLEMYAEQWLQTFAFYDQNSTTDYDETVANIKIEANRLRARAMHC